MSASDTELSQKLTQAISQEVPSIFGDGCELALIPPQRLDRRYSFMFRFWFRKPGGDLIPLLVKIPHESWMETMQQAIESAHIRDVVMNEFERMTSIAVVISEADNPDLFAIRPGSVIPEFNALLMEEIPIRMLKSSLTRPKIMLGMNKDWQGFERQLKLAGGWLRIIHDRFSSKKAATLKSLKMDEKLETEVDILEGFLTKPLTKLRGHFLHLYDSLNAVDLPLSCLHNDFHLGNIFVTGDGRVGALDPNWVEDGSVYADLSTLMIDPIVRKEQVLFQGLSFRPSLRMRYEHAVLQGYYGVSQYPDPMLDFYCALAVLNKWRMDEERLIAGDSRLFHTGSLLITPLIRDYFQKLILGYLTRGLNDARVGHEQIQGL